MRIEVLCFTRGWIFAVFLCVLFFLGLVSFFAITLMVKSQFISIVFLVLFLDICFIFQKYVILEDRIYLVDDQEIVLEEIYERLDEHGELLTDMLR